MRKYIKSFLLITAVAFVLAGCSIFPPETSLKNYLDSFKDVTRDNIDSYLNIELDTNNDETRTIMEDVYVDIINGFEYEIINVDKDGNNATVNLKVTSVDISEFQLETEKTFTDLLENDIDKFKNLTEDEIVLEMAKLYKETLASYESTTREVKIELIKGEDNLWSYNGKYTVFDEVFNTNNYLK